MKIPTLLLLLACLSVASAAVTRATYCGRHLAWALDVLCASGSVELSAEMNNAVELGPPEAPAVVAGARRKRGIVADCCDQPCSVDEIIAYC